MKLLALLTVATLGVASLQAGGGGSYSSGGYGKAPSYGKGPSNAGGGPVGGGISTVSGNCDDCFRAGATDFSLYLAGLEPDGAGILDDGLGAGLAVSHWYTRHFGTELSATWFDNHSVIHSVQASAIARYPIAGTCLAPYILAGVGYHANSVSQSTTHYGGGLDLRLSGCTGIFADYVYTNADDSEDYSVIRAGIRRGF